MITKRPAGHEVEITTNFAKKIGPQRRCMNGLQTYKTKISGLKNVVISRIPREDAAYDLPPPNYFFFVFVFLNPQAFRIVLSEHFDALLDSRLYEMIISIFRLVYSFAQPR